MDTKTLVELFGYLGSALVVISMLLTSVKKLRIVNTTGSVIFAIYALIIHSYPTALMNFCLVTINIYQLIKLSRTDRNYRLLETQGSGPVISYILDYYDKDIRHFFPEMDKGVAEECNAAYLVLIDVTPAGFLIGNRIDADTIDIKADYTLPAYRDCSVGKFLYRRLPEKGIHRLLFRVSSVDHEPYMEKMGFTRTQQGYEKNLQEAR